MHESLDDDGETQSRLDLLGWETQLRSGCDVTRTCLTTFCRDAAIYTQIARFFGTDLIIYRNIMHINSLFQLCAML